MRFHSDYCFTIFLILHSQVISKDFSNYIFQLIPPHQEQLIQNSQHSVNQECCAQQDY